MKIFYFIIVACVIHINLFAQSAGNNDSLLQVVKYAKNDSNKVYALLALSDLFENNEPEKAIGYSRQAYYLSNQIKFKKGVMMAYRNLAYIFTFQSRYDSMLHYNMLVYDMAEKNKDTFNIGVSMFNIGEGYKFLGDYEKSIDFQFKAIQILEGKGYDNIEANLYGGLQSTYFKLKQYNRSVEYGVKAIEIARKNKTEGILMVVLENMGHCYFDMKELAKAEQCYNEAIQLAHKNENKFTEIICYEGKVDIALTEKRFDDIKTYSDHTMQLSMETSDSSGICVSHYNLGLYQLLKKDFSKADQETKAALAIAREGKFRENESKVLKLMALIASARQDIYNAIDFSTLADEINSSIFTEAVAEKDAEMRTRFETEKKETQIKLQQAELKQKSNLNYFLITGSAALLLILLLGYRNYRSRQNLQQTKINELETEKKLTATEAVLKGEEQERTRLAKDLHDGLGGMLSGIKYSLSNMKQNLIMTPDNAQAFERSIDMLDSSIKEMRRVAHNMMPEILVKYGLNTALKEFCNEIDQSGVLHVSYQFVGGENTAPEQTTTVAIYRIVQELVNNAIKHAAARNVLVQLHIFETEKQLTVTVEDDGNGFDTATLNNAAGMGWRNIKNRVDFLKGKIDIRSTQGNGTSVLIEVNI